MSHLFAYWQFDIRGLVENFHVIDGFDDGLYELRALRILMDKSEIDESLDIITWGIISAHMSPRACCSRRHNCLAYDSKSDCSRNGDL